MSQYEDGASQSTLTSLPATLALAVKIVFQRPVLFLAFKAQITTRSA